MDGCILVELITFTICRRGKQHLTMCSVVFLCAHRGQVQEVRRLWLANEGLSVCISELGTKVMGSSLTAAAALSLVRIDGAAIDSRCLGCGSEFCIELSSARVSHVGGACMSGKMAW